MDALVAQVADFIASKGLLRPSERLVAAVSGGADSMALLECLGSLGYPIIVAHLDHGMRQGSWDEAKQVLRQAAKRGLPAIAERVDVINQAAPGENLEMAARRLRYDFLARVATETDSKAVATGHTADDQIETFLLHLLRGSGTQGLRGMLPEQLLSGIAETSGAAGVRLVRPMLSVWRSETVDFCRRNGIPFITDPTNLDLTYSRNRVRLELIPQLESYNPQVRMAIYRAALATAEAHAAVDQMVTDLWPVMAAETGDGVLLRLAEMRKLPEAARRIALRRSILACKGRSDETAPIERLEQMSQHVSPSHAVLGAGVEAWRAGDRLFVVRGSASTWEGFPQWSAPHPRLLQPGRRARLADGWALTCERSTAPRHAVDGGRRARTMDSVRVAIGRHAQPLIVRPWTEGDRMRPLGVGGSVKVTDLLARAHVPPPCRRAWPVVLLGEEIVWLPGVRRSERCRDAASPRGSLALTLVAPAGKPSWLEKPHGLGSD